MSIQAPAGPSPAAVPVKHRFKAGDEVVFTNTFGVCWGVKTIVGLDERHGPTYFITPTDSPWFSTSEEHLILADEEDRIMDQWGFEAKWVYFQEKYGFTPKETYGCW